MHCNDLHQCAIRISVERPDTASERGIDNLTEQLCTYFWLQNISEHFTNFKIIFILQDTLKYFNVPQDISRYSRIFQGTSEYSNVLQDISHI